MIKQANTCTVSGVLSAGGYCSRLIGPDTNDLSFNELLDMISAQSERTCVPVPGYNICADDQTGTPVLLPKRGSAIIIPSDDFGTMATELEKACRMIGSNCSYQTIQAIKAMKTAVKNSRKRIHDTQPTVHT